MKGTNWVDNHQMIKTAKYITLLVMKKIQFYHFSIISLWELSVPWQPNQEADHNIFSYFEFPYQSNICTKLELYYVSGFGGDII